MPNHEQENDLTLLLSKEERDTLQTIYNTRRRFLFSAISSIGLLIAFTFRSIIIHSFFTSKMDVSIIFVIVLLLFFLLIGFLLFMKSIYPFKKDMDLGRKDTLEFTITNKLYFPITNEYFFSIDDLDILNYEVDSKLYNAKAIGDKVNIYRGVYSKYIFQNNSSFQLL